jgi:RNA 2',3'-cyclic 3'-phosphodiesterase
MTLPPVIRIFFAIDLPPKAKEKIGSYISVLKKKSKSHAIRWTKPENLHITLQFLAEVKTEHLKKLIENVRAHMADAIKHSAMTVGSVKLFPNPYRPRVIVLEMMPQEALTNLSTLIGHGIKASDYEVESRPFRGHLTLGRIKHAQGVNLSFLSELPIPDVEVIEVNEVLIYRSEPQPEGSKYTVLEKIELAL